MSNKKLDLTGLKLSKEEKQEIRDCPHEIIDVQKFLRHLRAKAQFEKMIDFVASDKTEVNLRAPANRIKEKVAHLSEKEQKKILSRANLVNSLATKSRNFFKSSIGGYSEGYDQNKANHEKLLSDRKAELLEYFGRFYSVDEVHTITRKDWGTSKLGKQELSLFIKDNYDEINRMKEKYKGDFEHLRLSHKSSRLEEMTWLYNKLKLKYEKSGSREDHRVLLQTITEIRKEVEGDRLTIEGSIDINTQEIVNDQIRNELMRTIPLREIIVGRLAAKQGVNVSDIINDMGQSYYARMNKLLGQDVEEVEFEEIGFPSEQAYDFEKIERIQEERRKKKVEDSKKVSSKKDNTVDREKNKVLKDALLEKLRRKAVESKKSQEELRKRLS